jgi:hypothetical protein
MSEDKKLVDHEPNDYEMGLRRRIMDLEGCLMYVRNLPAPLKQHVEEVLWPSNKNQI